MDLKMFLLFPCDKSVIFINVKSKNDDKMSVQLCFLVKMCRKLSHSCKHANKMSCKSPHILGFSVIRTKHKHGKFLPLTNEACFHAYQQPSATPEPHVLIRFTSRPHSTAVWLKVQTHTHLRICSVGNTFK